MIKTKALESKCKSLGLRYVPGAGNPYSKLWVIGEAPGEDEERALQPFVGRSGGFLNAGFTRNDINRSSVFIHNISPVRPPANNFDYLSSTGICLEECLEALYEQIEVFKPNCVFAAGGIALKYLTGKDSITTWRGYILKCGETKVVGSFHPANILRLMKFGEKSAKKEREGKGGVKYTYGTARMTFLLDMKRAKEEAEFREVCIPKRLLFVDPNRSSSVDLIDKLTSKKEVAFDIETKGDWVDLIALACEDFSVSLPLRDEIKETLKKLLATHQGLIAQNASFDIGKLKKIGLSIGKLYVDTMICHNLLYPGWPHGLDYLSSIYCKLSELPHCPGWDLPENRSRKNAEHAALTLEIWKKLEAELKSLEKGI